MSFEINWEALNGDGGLTEGLKDFLNDKLADVDMPDYIDNLQVVAFDLGPKGPELAIRDIDYPFPEFYGESDASVIHTSRATTRSGSPTYRGAADGRTGRYNGATVEPRMASPSPMPAAASMMIPNQGSPYFQGVHNGVGIGAFGLKESESPFPEDDYGHSDDDYSNLQPVPMAPDISIDGVHDQLDATSQNSMAAKRTTSLTTVDEDSIEEVHRSVMAGSSASETDDEDDESPDGRPHGDKDVQLTLDFHWESKIYIEVTCSLAVNYPSRDFITLPVRLKISDLLIHNLAVLAYLDNCVFISFLCDIDDVPDPQDDGSPTPHGGNTSVDSNTGFLKNGAGRDESGDRIDIIKDLKIEGELGDYDDNAPDSPSGPFGPIITTTKSRTPYSSNPTRVERQSLSQLGTSMTTSESGTVGETSGNGSVLRNIGKIEKFIVGTLRKILVNEMAWPSWIELDMHEYSDEEEDDDDDSSYDSRGDDS